MYRYYQRKVALEPTIANYSEMAKWNNRWYRLEYPNAIQRAWWLMEYDLTKEMAEFIIEAIDFHLESFPEYQEQADRFIELLAYCQETYTTLHVKTS